ncbi:MAG: T9SS type B sorting domain-containing protein [Crocinitomicaceae bacterium]|nr:MAG: T9SS type B sorting domain-containing protein [Crocinitomicaceae bacterium]
MRKHIVLSLLSLSFIFSAVAQVVDPFSIRYQNQQKGGIAMLSNVSVSCTNCNTTIAQVPPAGNGINNNFTMTYVDIDGNPSTFMSSSDSLNLANCSEVLWAGLYWSARVSTGGTPTTTTNYTTRNQIKLKVNNGAYQTLVADDLLDNSTGHQTYHCYKNITSIVQGGGIKARYTVADLVTRTGVSAVYGGWTIVVVYKNVYESMRNLTVFDGLANVSTGNSVTIPISGFVTPLVGPVNFELGVVSHDGDRSDVGDQLLFNGAGSFVNVSDAAHNANDVFNSSIAYNGVLTPFRNPSLNNTLGHDASIFKPVNTSLNYIGNNTNSANIQITTGGETILTSVVTSVIDVFEPDLRATVYISDLNGGQVNPGDQLEYTVVGKNIGSDVSLGTFITDTLDPRTVYVPNSLSITYGQNSGPKTDAFADDQAEYDPVNKVIIARIGTGANGSTGGAVANSPTGGDSTVLKFRVTVIDDCLMFQCDQTLEHKAYIFGTGNISGNSYNNSGLSDLYDAFGCPTIASDILSINVAACPITAITYNSPICIGETIQFSLPSSPNANYAWTGPIGFTSSIHNPSISNATSANQGIYNVEITFDGLDCVLDTFATVIVNVPPTIQLNSITNVNCFNENTGAISITASGNGPFTYAWSNGNTSANPTGLTAGTYTVTVTNSNTCTATQTFNVTQSPQLTGSIQNQTNYFGYNVSCFENNADGSTLVTVSGGTPGYTYLWNNGMTNNFIFSLTAGTYSVVVTDSLGCTLNLSTVLTKPPKLELNLTGNNVQCFGESNGSATVTPTGGVAPYTYFWNNGPQTAQLTNLSAGQYIVSVYDANFCLAQDTITILAPSFPLEFAANTVDVLCTGENTGSIFVSPFGGTVPWSFAWSTGATTQDLENITAGTYSLTLSDANGCTFTDSYTINQPASALNASFVATPIACFGQSTGAIDLTVTGGTGTINYAWNNGATTQDLSGISSGNYTVTISDEHNCSISIPTISVTQPAAALALNEQITPVSCFGGSDGQITSNPTGGTAPYTFLWSTGATTANISNLTQGTYSLTITDNNNCQFTENYTVTQPTAPLALTETSVDVLCFGQSTASIDVSVSGGTPVYTYSWSTGATTQDLSNLSTGTYQLTVTDAELCSQTITVEITQPASAISATATIQNVSCFGLSDGSIDVSPTGGTGAYTYTWNNSNTAQDLINYPASNYFVTVTDANNCAVTLTNLNISQPAAVLQTALTPTAVNCFGENTGAIVQATVGGTAPYTYTWNTGATSQNLTGIPAGTYTVDVIDINGCTTSATTSITQPAAPLQLSESHVDILCFGESTGSIDATAVGGTAPYTFAWSNGQTTSDLTAIASGVYSLTGSDQLGCSALISVTVLQPIQPLMLTETHTDALCIGAQQGTIDLQVSGGTSPYVYAWNNASTNEDQINLLAGQYVVLVTDNNNCQASLNVEILDPSNTTVLSETHTNVACFTESTGAIDLLVTGGVAPHTFAWTTGAITEDISNLAAGNYAVNVLDLNGCGEFLSVLITEPSTAVTATSIHTDVLCNGYNTGTMEVTPNGGVGPYTFSWNNGETSAQISNLTAGTYTVIVTDDNGCDFTLSDVISEPANPVAITENITDVNCFGENTGQIQIDVAGGTAPYNYAWNTGATSSSISSLVSGSYELTVTDQNNCVYSEIYQIDQPTAPLATSNSVSTVSCFTGSDGSIDFTVTGGTAPYVFAWSNGQTTEDLVNLVTGTYSVVVTDAKGCTISASVTVSQPNAPLSIAFSQTNVLCHEVETGAINITVSGGTPSYSFAWSNGLQTEDITNLPDGSYAVTVEDSRGCLANQSVQITQPVAPLHATSTQVNVACHGESTGSIDVSVTGGTSPYTYAWNSGQSSQDLSSIPTGTYSLEITDFNGCGFLLPTVQVTQPTAPLSDAFVSVPVACFGESTGSVSTTISGGTTPYSYLWSTGATNSQITNQPAGNYTLTVTDHQGCVFTNSYAISQPLAALGLDLSMNPVICFGESNGNVSASVSGGTTPYSYAWNSGQTTDVVTGLPAGNYTVVVTDFNNCQISETIEITQPDALAIQLSAVDVLCHGLATGSASVDAIGGQGAYTYSWTNGATTASISNLVAGNYEVTVTDENNCSFTNSIDVNQPTAPLAFDFATTDNVCFGGTSGSATVVVSGGTAPYTSGWSNSISSLTNPNLAAGIYSFQTTDANNCVLTESIEIFEPTQISITDSVRTNISCFDFTDGAINFTTLGGTPGYSYAWSNGATTEDISNLADGVYSVQITDANNCQRSFNFQLTEPEVLVASTTIDEPSCFGYTDGSIFTTTSGGTLPYVYAWSNGATTADNTEIPTGTYDLTITDNNNCVVEVTTLLTQPAQIQVSFDANVLVGCDPLEVKLTNTSLEQHISDWTFGDGNTGSGTQIEHTFTGEGCYDITLEITDINGCSNSVTYADFICVLETPDAEIGITNVELGVPYPETNITNLSTDSDSYSWNLGGSIDYDYFEPGDVSFPAYVVDQFLITLIAYNDNGCVDSAVRIIYFDNRLVMYVPNTFTPNGDEFNQIFKPVFAEEVTAYNLKIFNRWGEMIFESNDTNLGWDGTYNGVLVQDGTYTWDIWVNTYDAHIYRKQGVVNVLK